MTPIAIVYRGYSLKTYPAAGSRRVAAESHNQLSPPRADSNQRKIPRSTTLPLCLTHVVSNPTIHNSSSPGNDSTDTVVLHLLPALPSAWPSGRFRGLRGRGRIEVDVQWQGGSIIEANIRSIISTTPAPAPAGAQTDLHQEFRGGNSTSGSPLRCRVLSRARLVFGAGSGRRDDDSLEARLGFRVSDPVVQSGISWNVVDFDVGILLPGEEVRLVAQTATTQ